MDNNILSCSEINEEMNRLKTITLKNRLKKYFLNYRIFNKFDAINMLISNEKIKKKFFETLSKDELVGVLCQLSTITICASLNRVIPDLVSDFLQDTSVAWSKTVDKLEKDELHSLILFMFKVENGEIFPYNK